MQFFLNLSSYFKSSVFSLAVTSMFVGLLTLADGSKQVQQPPAGSHGRQWQHAGQVWNALRLTPVSRRRMQGRGGSDTRASWSPAGPKTGLELSWYPLYNRGCQAGRGSDDEPRSRLLLSYCVQSYHSWETSSPPFVRVALRPGGLLSAWPFVRYSRCITQNRSWLCVDTACYLSTQRNSWLGHCHCQFQYGKWYSVSI